MSYRSLLLAAAISLSLAAPAWSEDFTAGSITISNPWARATPKGATIGGAYMTITNKGQETDRLIGGSSPVAGKLELHQNVHARRHHDHAVAYRRPGGQAGPDRDVTPDTFHIMLTGLKQPLTQGEHIKATLEFAKAGKVEVEYAVEGIGDRLRPPAAWATWITRTDTAPSSDRRRATPSVESDAVRHLTARQARWRLRTAPNQSSGSTFTIAAP